MDIPETLGLSFAPKAETATIFRPELNDNKYNHDVVLYQINYDMSVVIIIFNTSHIHPG